MANSLKDRREATMPTVPRPGLRPVYVELEQDLADRLEALAGRNRRTLKAEITIAIEKHVGGEKASPAAVQPLKQPEAPSLATFPPRITEGAALPTTRGRYLLFIGEPVIQGEPRWVHFSWRDSSFCLRDFLRGGIRRHDATIQAVDVWRAALKRKPADGRYFHQVGDWEWWKTALEELSAEE
jgi:hypothetical protein